VRVVAGGAQAAKSENNSVVSEAERGGFTAGAAVLTFGAAALRRAHLTLMTEHLLIVTHRKSFIKN